MKCVLASKICHYVFIVSAFLSVTMTGSACDAEDRDMGFVRDVAGCSEQQNVLVFTVIGHNHWASGGTFTVTDTAKTANTWSVGAKAGYESGASASLLGQITIQSKISVEVSGALTGNKEHSIAIADSSEKQHCKCLVYEHRVHKPTEAWHKKIERWLVNCTPGDPDHFMEIKSWDEGTGTGDYFAQEGVMSYYDYTQDEKSCKDCYGTDGDCPLMV